MKNEELLSQTIIYFFFYYISPVFFTDYVAHGIMKPMKEVFGHCFILLSVFSKNFDIDMCI